MAGGIGRRLFLGGMGATIAAPALAQLADAGFFADYPFKLGVASGDPSADGFVLWTRLAPDLSEPGAGLPRRPLPVRWEVSDSRTFAKLAASGEALARPELGHSVHVTVSGLAPGRPWFYRFIAGGERSATGRARTLAEADADVQQVRIGVAGCQDWQAGLYTAFAHLAREELDAVFHYGDYMYEYGPRASFLDRDTGLQVPSVRRHEGPMTFSLDDYRRRYMLIRSDIDLQNAHAAHPFLMSFDDHEVVNNWVSDIAPDGTPPELFRLRRQAAMQAWYEFMPVRAEALPGADGLSGPWRHYRFGRLVDARLLNTRSHRTDQPCGDRFGTFCPEVNSPRAEVLGRAQEDWLVDGLTRRPGRWNALLQQVMMMDLDRARQAERGVNPDSWAGYAVPRDRLLRRLVPVSNLVVLTGDEHQHWAGHVRPTGADPERTPAAAVEFVTTSISSGGDGPGERAEHAEIRRRNPGLVDVCDQRGYSVMTATPEAWTAEMKVVDTVRTPGGRLSTHATFRVAAGASRIERA